eukprot:5937305-Amphidinium_carterae.2
MSSVLGRSDFDPIISNAHRGGRDPENVTVLPEGGHVPSIMSNSPLGMPIIMECYTYSGRKSNHKLSPFLNCPGAHGTPLAVHLSSMRSGQWNGSLDFFKVVKSRHLVVDNTMARFQSIREVIAVNDDAQMWLICPSNGIPN